MDLTLLAALISVAATAYGVPPDNSKFVPVFVSSDALNRLEDKGKGHNGNQLNDELGHEVTLNQRSLNDYNRKESPGDFNGPAPVFEHPTHDHDMQTQQQYPGNQSPQIHPQYEISQPQSYQMVQPAPTQQSYQQPYQFVQQGQPQQPYLINQQPGQMQQPILMGQVAQAPQPIYANQQQMGQPLNNQQTILLNQQQLVPNQPIQTYQQQQPIFLSQPNQVLTQPNGQILLNQPPLPNQQAILLQSGQGPQQTLISRPNPVFAQPNQNGNVYAVVPINQNAVPNQNTNTYLVPVQQLPQQVYAMNAGK